jgi:hypothetical protein
LNAPTELPCQCSRNLVDVRAKALIEEFAKARIVIDTANDAANLSTLFKPVEARIDSGATTEVKKVSG